MSTEALQSESDGHGRPTQFKSNKMDVVDGSLIAVFTQNDTDDTNDDTDSKNNDDTGISAFGVQDRLTCCTS